MSLEDLREHGVILPEREWGTRELTTTLPLLPALAAFLAATTGLALAYAGDGTPLTWVGIALFLAAFFTLTWLCDRAVRAERRRVRKGRKKTAGAGARSAKRR